MFFHRVDAVVLVLLLSSDAMPYCWWLSWHHTIPNTGWFVAPRYLLLRRGRHTVFHYISGVKAKPPLHHNRGERANGIRHLRWHDNRHGIRRCAIVLEEDLNDCCMLSLDVSWHDRANSMMTLLAARRIHLLIRFLPLYLNPINKHPLKFHFLQHPWQPKREPRCMGTTSRVWWVDWRSGRQAEVWRGRRGAVVLLALGLGLQWIVRRASPLWEQIFEQPTACQSPAPPAPPRGLIGG